MAPDPLVTVSGRILPSTIQRLDVVAEALGKRRPGEVVKRSDALRVAIERGVEGLERELGLGSSPTPSAGAEPSKASTPKGGRTGGAPLSFGA